MPEVPHLSLSLAGIVFVCLCHRDVSNLLFQSPISETVLAAIPLLWSWLPIPAVLWDFRFLLFSFSFLKMESGGWCCLVLLLSAWSKMAHWEFIFCSSGWGSVVHLWRDCGCVKASTDDRHLLTLCWSSFTRRRCPPLSLRINLTSSDSFSFYRNLETETVLKKFRCENIVGALAILFNRVVNRWNWMSEVLFVLI